MKSSIVRDLISVVIPVYNSETTLERCVNSICAQTWENIEIILVDDGSTDKSGYLCDKYAARFSNINVVHKKNEGQGRAKNDGINASTGRYIAFVDSDDWIEKECLEQALIAICENNADLCSYAYVQEDEQNKVVYRCHVKNAIYQNEEIKHGFVLHFFGDDLKNDELRGVSSAMTLYNADIIKQNKICFATEREVLSEDTVFNLELCKYISTAVTIPNMYYHYCIHESSFSREKTENRLTMAYDFQKILHKYARQYEIDDIVSNRICMTMWVAIVSYIKQTARKNAQTNFTEHIRKMKELAICTEVTETIDKLDISAMSFSQRFLLHAIKNKNAFIMYVLGALRSKTNIR